jgi:drug/metabolite transporter (DMT)-like permease
MALGMFLFSAVDTQAKFLTQTLHPIQIVWTRQLGLLAGALVLVALNGPALFRTGHPVLQIVRGALAGGSATLFIVAVSYIPLADAVALSFVAPFIVTILGAALLREPVGLRRWLAVAGGFLGTLVVIRPGLGVMHPAAFLVLIAATLFALRQIISRALSDTDRTITTIAYTAVVGSAVLTLPLPFVWRWPGTGLEITLMVSIAILAGAAEVCVIKSLEIAMAVVVAPVQYTLILWGTIYGFLVFGQLPDMWTWAGTAIIIATGLYTLHRERLASRREGGT